MKKYLRQTQHGLSLTGLIFILVILGIIAIIGMKVVPTVSEYFAIKKAIVIAKESGKTVRDIQTSFDKQASASYIDSISGKDLEIIRDGENFEVSFAYEKKISLMGPLSLVIDYRGGTARKSSGSKID